MVKLVFQKELYQIVSHLGNGNISQILCVLEHFHTNPLQLKYCSQGESHSVDASSPYRLSSVKQICWEDSSKMASDQQPQSSLPHHSH